MANDRNDFAPEIRNLINIFEYKDGLLYRKNGQFKGLAGTLHHSGYWQVKVGKKSMWSHKIIFAIHHGYFAKQIDHIDGNKLNNRIENLRESTSQQNHWNVGVSKNNKSGYKNIYFQNNRWRVMMRIDKKMTQIGSYEDIELAQLVAIEARNKYHKEFANHG
jgi:HNH endonuclease